MSVDTNQDPAQPSDPDRREARGGRVPFEGIVEVGGALGPSFEAQAIDVSKEGIHLRTAYLPELGQPLTCRIELGSEVVLAAGEVVWRQEEDRGGEFGMRFTELDAASEAALRRLVTVEPTFAAGDAGTRVRLHIEGLGSPMRARVRGSAAEGLVVGSDSGFLQVGKELELEDAATGGKRGARIHRVGVEVNPETQIPQLVVSLRYDDTDADVPVVAGVPTATAEDTPEPSVIDDENPRGAGRSAAHAAKKRTDEGDGDSFGPMRSGVGEAFHRASAKVGPALGRLGAQAATAMALVAARARKAAGRGDDGPPLTRRTTAPAPAGGLHAAGRKVVRSERPSALEAVEGGRKMPVATRRIAVGSAVLVAGVLALAAVRRPAPTAQTSGPTDSSGATTPAAGVAAPPVPVASALAASTTTLNPAPAPVSPEEPAAPIPSVSNGHKKPVHVTPFGNGAVAHASVLHLKMDGVIEKIEGATTPTGFNVVIPDRRSLEAAAPLAAHDSRIAAIRITNEANGAELAVSFKDGVPNYQVRAKGDSLEILLAPQGKLTDLDDGKTAKRRHAKQ